MLAPLGRDFFRLPVEELAPRLLGCFLVAGEVVLRISETEAYGGFADPGSHAYRGRTKRNATMFGNPGQLYVYRHLGLHSCCNIVGDTSNGANAVLLRAGEIVAGIKVAKTRRLAVGVSRSEVDLAKGPGRLSVALGISYLADGLDLCSPNSSIYLADRHGPTPAIGIGPRIGLRPEATEPKQLQLRFCILDDPTLSGKPGAIRS